MRWALLGLIVLGGCAPSLKMQNPDTSRWKAPEMSKYPDAPAVVLAHEEEWLTVARPRSRWYTEQRLLHVVAIQSESAFNKFGKFTMRRHERSTELVGFRARNIRPDGEVVEVGRDAFISEEEHGDEDDEVYTVDALTFPRVVVGSIIEVELIHRYKGVRFEVGRFPMTRIPVQRYRLSFSGSDEVRYAMRVFNSDTKIQVDKDAGPGWRLSWALDDLPARPRGDFLPHRSSIEPWARMRVKQVVFPYHTWSFRKDRKGVNRSKAIPLYIENEEELEGFAERVDVSDCSGPRCKVGRVVNWVREHTHYVGEGVETKRASHHEKAFLTRTLLEGAGVESRFAYARRFRTWQVGLDFPNSRAFDHILVYVPEQEGLAAPLWIDPACEACEAGELPQYARGVPAQILFAKKKAKGEEVMVRTTVTQGEPAPTSETREHLKLRLAADGGLEGAVESTWLGGWASHRHRMRRTWTDRRWEENAERLRDNRWPTGTLSEVGRDTCRKRPASCTRAMKLEIPEYATELDGRLIVPLGVLGAGRGELFGKKGRTHEISVRDHGVVADHLELTIPEGWRVAKLPGAAELSGPGFAFRLAARVEGGTVHVERTLTRTPGGYPVARYAEIRKPVRAFVDARAETITLERVR